MIACGSEVRGLRSLEACGKQRVEIVVIFNRYDYLELGLEGVIVNHSLVVLRAIVRWCSVLLMFVVASNVSFWSCCPGCTVVVWIFRRQSIVRFNFWEGTHSNQNSSM